VPKLLLDKLNKAGSELELNAALRHDNRTLYWTLFLFKLAV